MNLFFKSQFPHKFVNVSCMLVVIKDKYRRMLDERRSEGCKRRASRKAEAGGVERQRPQEVQESQQLAGFDLWDVWCGKRRKGRETKMAQETAQSVCERA